MPRIKDRKNIECILTTLAHIYSPNRRKKLMQSILEAPDIVRLKPLYLATWGTISYFESTK